MKSSDIGRILSEDMNDDVLDRMPEWFKRLREAYLRKVSYPERR